MPRVPSTIRAGTDADEVGADDGRDAAAEDAVRQALTRRLSENAARIEVHARGGVVTLLGWVADEAVRARASFNILPPVNPRGI